MKLPFSVFVSRAHEEWDEYGKTIGYNLEIWWSGVVSIALTVRSPILLSFTSLREPKYEPQPQPPPDVVCDKCRCFIPVGYWRRMVEDELCCFRCDPDAEELHRAELDAIM